jgi:hypothetical protein
MAGGGQFKNPYQQPGGAYGQAIGRSNIGGRQQMPTPRQIGPMGPGAGMALAQQIPQAIGGFGFPNQQMPQQQMPQQMPPGFERQFMPLTAQNPYSAMPQQGPQNLQAQLARQQQLGIQPQMPNQQMPQQTTNTRYLGELSTVPPEYRAQEEALRAYAAQRQQMPQQGPQNLLNYQAMMEKEKLAQMLGGQTMPQTGGGMQQPRMMGLGGLGIAGLQRI